MQLDSCREDGVPSGLEIRSARELPAGEASTFSDDIVGELTGDLGRGAEGVLSSTEAEGPSG